MYSDRAPFDVFMKVNFRYSCEEYRGVVIIEQNMRIVEVGNRLKCV